MEQITKSIVSVCHSVSLSVNTPTAVNWFDFDEILHSDSGTKSKIEFVCDKKNLITPSPILPHFKKFALRPMETSKRYNSVPVKDNCALCLHTPYFRGRAI